MMYISVARNTSVEQYKPDPSLKPDDEALNRIVFYAAQLNRKLNQAKLCELTLPDDVEQCRLLLQDSMRRLIIEVVKLEEK